MTAPDEPLPRPPATQVLDLPFELQRDESIILFARRHWVFFVSNLVLFALAGIVATLVVLVLIQITVGFDGTHGKLFGVLLFLWVIYWAIRAYFHWYRFRNDIWAVTDQRLVDSIKKHWFHHQMASADLVDVEDI